MFVFVLQQIIFFKSLTIWLLYMLNENSQCGFYNNKATFKLVIVYRLPDIMKSKQMFKREFVLTDMSNCNVQVIYTD